MTSLNLPSMIARTDVVVRSNDGVAIVGEIACRFSTHQLHERRCPFLQLGIDPGGQFRAIESRGVVLPEAERVGPLGHRTIEDAALRSMPSSGRSGTGSPVRAPLAEIAGQGADA